VAQENFMPSLARVLVYEGGKVDHPKDPGGRTNKGVTQATFNAWMRRKGLPTRDVWTATDAEIGAIYKTMYWDRIKGDQLPAGLDFVLFDIAVNSGVGNSAKWCQRALGCRPDGDFGPKTVDAILDDQDNDALIAKILSIRLGVLKSLNTYATFGKGWSARIANVKKIGQAWASGSVGPAPVAVYGLLGNAKANVGDDELTKSPVSAGQAQASAALNTAGTTASSIADQVQAFTDSISWLMYVFLGLTVLSMIALAVATYLKNKAEKAQNGTVTAVVDSDADQGIPEVAVNDNFPAQEQAA
jgi:lysozyme family protein